MYRYWTPEDVSYLWEYYGVAPAVKIAKVLCRSTRAVQEKAAALGLKFRFTEKWSEVEEALAVSTAIVPGRSNAAVRTKRWRKKK